MKTSNLARVHVCVYTLMFPLFTEGYQLQARWQTLAPAQNWAGLCPHGAYHPVRKADLMANSKCDQLQEKCHMQREHGTVWGTEGGRLPRKTSQWLKKRFYLSPYEQGGIHVADWGSAAYRRELLRLTTNWRVTCRGHGGWQQLYDKIRCPLDF